MVNYRAAATGMRYCLQVLKGCNQDRGPIWNTVDERVNESGGGRDKKTKRRNIKWNKEKTLWKFQGKRRWEKKTEENREALLLVYREERKERISPSPFLLRADSAGSFPGSLVSKWRLIWFTRLLPTVHRTRQTKPSIIFKASWISCIFTLCSLSLKSVWNELSGQSRTSCPLSPYPFNGSFEKTVYS